MKKLAGIYFGIVVICTWLIAGLPFYPWGGGSVKGDIQTPIAAIEKPAVPAATANSDGVAVPTNIANLTALIMQELNAPAPSASPASEAPAAETLAATTPTTQTPITEIPASETLAGAAADTPAPAVVAFKLSDASVSDTALGVLADLNGVDSAPSATDMTTTSLFDMTVSALNAPSAKAGSDVPASLEVLVADGLRQGQSDEAIDLAVNQAAAAGTITVPETLVTTEGNVDTSVLLATILTTAGGEEFGQGDLSPGNLPVDELSQQLDTQPVQYSVTEGDSLGSLALRFYADAGKADAIFKANRQHLETPNALVVGMILTLPARNAL